MDLTDTEAPYRYRRSENQAVTFNEERKYLFKWTDITFCDVGVRKTACNYRALRSRNFFSSGKPDNIETKYRNTVMISSIFRTSPANELKMCLVKLVNGQKNSWNLKIKKLLNKQLLVIIINIIKTMVTLEKAIPLAMWSPGRKMQGIFIPFVFARKNRSKKSHAHITACWLL